MASGTSTIVVAPYAFAAVQSGDTITLRRIKLGDPGSPLDQGFTTDPNIVDTLELYFEEYDGGRLWAVWQDSPTTLAWARYRFEAREWDSVVQTENIGEGGIEAAKEEIRKKVRKVALPGTPSA